VLVSDDGRHTAGVTTRLIVAFIRRRLGEGAIAWLLELAGETRPVEVLENEATWSSYRQKIALFEAAASLTGDPRVAERIGASVLHEQLGGLTRLVLATLASPQRLLRSIARANIKFSTSATMRAIETRPTGGVVAYRLHDEHEPNPHDCHYNQGLLSQVPVLFGLPAATVEHPHCQVEGDPECVYELRWPRRRRWRVRRRRDQARSQDLIDEGLRQQLAELGEAVADLVSAEDLDRVLPRIAQRAGAAVRAQHHLLAIRNEDGEHLLGDGIDPAEVTRLGHALLQTGFLDVPEAQVLTARVASARRDYGWLAAFNDTDAAFLPTEQDHLEIYAGLVAAALDVTSALQEERRSSELSAALLELSHQLAEEASVEGIATRAAQATTRVVGSDRASLLLWDEAAGRMTTTAVVGYGELTEQARAFEIPWGATPELERIFENPQPVRIDAETADPFVTDALAAFGHHSVVAVPIVGDDQLLGLVLATWLEERSKIPDTDTALAGLTGISQQTAQAIVRLRLLDEVRHAATHDGLTGLANRQLFHDRVELALADNRRSGRGCAVAFIDLDGFKRINDDHGHLAGDALLVEVARRIRAAVRETDSVARLAGDEFAVLLRDLEDRGPIDLVAPRVSEALHQPVEVDGALLPLRASIGVAIAPAHGKQADELVKAADRTMYEVKAAGGGYRIAGQSPR
jgi:diguanylate cyclase (GGDEF)-like protein